MNNSKYKHISDAELLSQFYADHDNEWLGILLERYTMLLLGVSMKYLKNEEEAKDAVQQVFLKAINELHKYKVEYFKSWIYMIAKNHCLMKLRNKGRFSGEINEQTLTTPAEPESNNQHIEKDKTLDTPGECPAAAEQRAATMCNFVLPGEKKLPGNCRAN